MQHHLILHEVEAIRDGLPRARNHLFHRLLRQIRQLVYGFHRVGGEGHAEWGCELVGFYQFIFEVMPFDHGKLFHWFFPHPKLKGGSDRLHFEEVWSKMIPDGPH